MNAYKSFAVLMLACLGLAGCAGVIFREEPGDWDISQTIEKRSLPDDACTLSFRTVNNTNKIFKGINASFILLDKGGKEIVRVSYFRTGNFLAGYGYLLHRSIAESCDQVADIKIAYLNFPTAYGYYEPRKINTEVKELQNWFSQRPYDGIQLCGMHNMNYDMCH